MELTCACLLLVLGCAETKPLTAALGQSFRGKKLNQEVFKLDGKGAKQYVHPEKTGLRITFPEERGPTRPIGIVLRAALRGDFAIVASYELLKLEAPKEGSGVGFSLFLTLATPDKEGIYFARQHRKKEGHTFVLAHMGTGADGKTREKKQQQLVPTNGDRLTGSLRLVRQGAMVCFAAKEGTGDFKELGEFRIGTEDVDLLQIAADPGRAQNPLDLRLAEARVQAEELFTASAPAPGSRFGVYVGLGAGVLLGGIAWRWVRRRRAKSMTPSSAR